MVHVWGTGLVGVLMGYSLQRTLESLRQTGDSSVNHENTPPGVERASIWTQCGKIKSQLRIRGCTVSSCSADEV